MDLLSPDELPNDLAKLRPMLKKVMADLREAEVTSKSAQHVFEKKLAKKNIPILTANRELLKRKIQEVETENAAKLQQDLQQMDDHATIAKKINPDTTEEDARVEEKFGEQNFRVLSEMRILTKIKVAILDLVG